MKHLGTSALALIFASGAAFAQTQTQNNEAGVQDESGEIIVQDQNTMQGGTTGQTQGTAQNQGTAGQGTVGQNQGTVAQGTAGQNQGTVGQNPGVAQQGTVPQNQGTVAQGTVGQNQGTVAQNQNAMNNREYTSDDMYNQRENLIRVTDITGSPIYSTANAEATNAEWEDTRQWTQIGEDWNQIGSIDDIVLSTDGEMTGIVAEVGGFLGIGDKHVVLSINDVNLVPSQDGSYAYVTRYSEDQLTDMEGLDEGFWN